MTITRRSLLRTSALGAAAFALPPILRAHDALASSGVVAAARI